MWAIHNSIKNWTFYSLNEREMSLIIQTLTANEIRLTFISSEESSWVQLNNSKHAHFFQKVAQDIEKFESYKNHFLSADDETDCFVIRPSRKHQLRVHDRKEAKVSVIIEGHGQIFKTESIDLSEGGIFLKEIIPEWLSGYFIVKIQVENQLYQLVCSLVEDQKIRQRIQIVSEENDTHFLNYKKWLISLN